MQKLNEYPTTKSVNYEFIRAWQIWKTSNIAAILIVSERHNKYKVDHKRCKS